MALLELFANHRVLSRSIFGRTAHASRFDEALNVVGLSESVVYDVTESEYVGKPGLTKSTRKPGCRTQRSAGGKRDSGTEVLREEVARLEEEIEELAEFSPGVCLPTVQIDPLIHVQHSGPYHRRQCLLSIVKEQFYSYLGFPPLLFRY